MNICGLIYVKFEDERTSTSLVYAKYEIEIHK